MEHLEIWLNFCPENRPAPKPMATGFSPLACVAGEYVLFKQADSDDTCLGPYDSTRPASQYQKLGLGSRDLSRAAFLVKEHTYNTKSALTMTLQAYQELGDADTWWVHSKDKVDGGPYDADNSVRLIYYNQDNSDNLKNHFATVETGSKEPLQEPFPLLKSDTTDPATPGVTGYPLNICIGQLSGGDVTRLGRVRVILLPRVFSSQLNALQSRLRPHHPHHLHRRRRRLRQVLPHRRLRPLPGPPATPPAIPRAKEKSRAAAQRTGPVPRESATVRPTGTA